MPKILITTHKFNIFQFSKILNTPSIFKNIGRKSHSKILKKIIEPRTPVEMSDFFFDGTKSWLDILRKRAEINEIALNQLPP